jgi:MOSC domain-containing protein YiiM
MKLLSVNVSPPREVAHGGKTVTTAIFKEPVDGRVMISKLNLDGDGQADLMGHGGIYKAAYAYSVENYNYWKRELGRTDFAFGQFGENFTVEGMLEDVIHVGDVFRVGSALIEVTQPRVPCYKLGLKMGLSGFEKRFLASCRVGFYMRVLEEGGVGAGDVFERVRTDPERMTVREICRLLYFDSENLEGTRRALRIRALSPGWRQSFEERLANWNSRRSLLPRR